MTARAAPGVLAVVVVYGRSPAEAAAWPTLQRWLAPAVDRPPRLAHVLVHDNSLQPAPGDDLPAKGCSYRHDPTNGGTRAAFAAAAVRARELGCDWLLLLDQDTVLPDDLLDHMVATLAEPMPAAVLPRVLHGATPISPAVISDLGIVRPLPLQAQPAAGQRTTAIASGTLIAVSALEAVGPLPPALWLDGVDHWIFCRLHALGRPVRVIDARIAHALSAVDPGSMPAWRIAGMLVSEFCLLGVLPPLARLAYPYRLLRALQRVRRHQPAAVRPAWQALRAHWRDPAVVPRPPQPIAPAGAAGPMVTVLLPVYNGAAYLPEQLDSLLAQQYPHWTCLVRDDGSRDGSMAVVRAYQTRHPERFRLVEDGHGNQGTVGCLNLLAAQVQTPLFAFCDQDDVWLPDKLARSVAALAGLDAAEDVPALAYGDLAVTDAALRPVAPSFWDLTGGRRYALGLRGMPVLNTIAGCTMVGNRALLRAAFPVPAAAPMHDWWVAMLAHYAGRAVAIEAPLLLYRQHGANQCGAGTQPPLWRRLAARLGALPAFRQQAEHARAARTGMLQAIVQRCPAAPRRTACLAALAAETGGRWRRLLLLLRQGIRPDHAFLYWLP